MSDTSITSNSKNLHSDFSLVASQIKDLYIGAITQSHLTLLDGYHQIGQLILALPSKYEAVKGIARLNGVSSRTLYNCALFAEKYPNFNQLPEGDNTTWTKMITKYLQESPNEDCEHEPIEITICRRCQKRL